MFSRLAQLFKPKPAKPQSVVRIEPLGVEIFVPQGRTILETALDKGVEFPNSCRVGGCGTCRCRLVEGDVKQRTDSSYVLSAEEISSGWILGCQSVPRSARVVVEVPDLGDPSTLHPTVTTRATIASLRPLTHDITELTVTLDKALTFTSGQNAELSVSDVTDSPRSYSFARWSGPGPSSTAVFHVRRVSGGVFTTWLHDTAHPGDFLHLTGPKGSFSLRPGTGPMLFIAGGSGLAPILAMLEQAHAENITREARLLYGARTQRDLYALSQLTELSRQWPSRFEFVPILSEEPSDSGWSGQRGLVTDAITPSLLDHTAWLCGPPAMIDAAVAKLTTVGLPPERVFTDRFTDRSTLSSQINT